MLARSNGRLPRPTPRGEVFRVEVPRLEPGSGNAALAVGGVERRRRTAEQGMRTGGIVAAVGEPGAGPGDRVGSGRASHYPRDRILSASAPAPTDVQTWLGLWGPELGKSHTAVIVRDVDLLPSWVAERLRDLVLRSGASTSVPFAVTAERFEDIPPALASLVDTVVPVPWLRDRPDDVQPLANHIATRARGRELVFTPSASRALRNYDWPGNVGELSRVIARAAGRADVIDVGRATARGAGGHHPSPLADRGVRARRDRPGARRRRPDDGRGGRRTGMSRATLYRRLRITTFTSPATTHDILRRRSAVA